MSISPQMWYTGQVVRAVIEAIPRFWSFSIPLIEAIERIYQCLFPFCSDDSLDEKGSYFRVTQERIERLAELAVSRTIRIGGVQGRESLERAIRETYKKIYVNMLNSYSRCIEALNAQYGISVQFFVNISDKHAGTCGAVGGKHSFSNPLIFRELWQKNLEPYLDVQLEQGIEEAQVIENLERDFSAHEDFTSVEEGQFVVAHEFSHILRDDELICAALRIVNVALHIFLFFVVGTFSTSLRGALVCFLSSSFITQVGFEIFLCAFRRRQEKRADMEAMQLLGTNQGAEEFFSYICEKIVKSPSLSAFYENRSVQRKTERSVCLSRFFSDFQYFYYFVFHYHHPTCEERLQYAREWKPA